MSTALKSYDSNLETVLAKAEELSSTGPAWLQEFRKSSLRTFREHGVPTPRTEDWKYTPLRQFAETEWALADSAPHQDVSAYDSDSVKVVVVNGKLSSIEGAMPTGLEVCSIATCVQDGSFEVQELIGQAGPKTTQTFDREITPDVYPFGALNDALFEDGVFIRIGAGAKIGPLIEVVHVSSPVSESSPKISLPRVMVVAEKGSMARMVESYISTPTDSGAVIAVTEVFVRETANLEHVRIQEHGPSSTHIGLWQTCQSKDSTYTAYNVCFGAQLARLDQSIWIEGEGCTTRLDGVVCANDAQHIDNHTRLDHAVPNCNSFEIYKQVIDDQATVVFNGKIFVHQDAQKTDAKQTNQALLLSREATIDSKPQLEIFADDVKCTHGATVGQLEDTPMFYMRSRGMPKDQAEAVLVYAFAAEVLEMISIDPVRISLEKKLYQKLGVDLT